MSENISMYLVDTMDKVEVIVQENFSNIRARDNGHHLSSKVIKGHIRKLVLVSIIPRQKREHGKLDPILLSIFP